MLPYFDGEFGNAEHADGNRHKTDAVAQISKRKFVR